MEFAEARAESHLLLVGKVLAREDQHGVPVERGFDGVPLIRRQLVERGPVTVAPSVAVVGVTVTPVPISCP